jgi:hypothetical protein
MSDDVKLVKAQREAFMSGVIWERRGVYGNRTPVEEAEARYPLPTVTVPRVVLAADGFQYRVIGGELQCYEGTNWVPMWFTQADLDAFTDLLANPTETREVTE